MSETRWGRAVALTLIGIASFVLSTLVFVVAVVAVLWALRVLL